MTEPDWFSVVEGEELEQGDLLRNCPVPVVHVPGGFAEGGEVDVDIQIHDLCVLTQSCDLANAKVDTVLLGRVVAWSDLVEARRCG